MFVQFLDEMTTSYMTWKATYRDSRWNGCDIEVSEDIQTTREIEIVDIFCKLYWLIF